VSVHAFQHPAIDKLGQSTTNQTPSKNREKRRKKVIWSFNPLSQFTNHMRLV
jgi:hypothetical protein